jgi:hypothetical protein
VWLWKSLSASHTAVLHLSCLTFDLNRFGDETSLRDAEWQDNDGLQPSILDEKESGPERRPCSHRSCMPKGRRPVEAAG